jgi:hypothetical protein
MKQQFEIDFLVSHDRESILAELKRVAAVLGTNTLRAKDIDRVGRISYKPVVDRFGSLRAALDAAGLRPSRFVGAKREDLIPLIAELWTITLRDSGRRPRMTDVAKYQIPIGVATILKVFGTWKKALVAVSEAMSGGKAVAPADPSKPRRRPLPVAKRYAVLKRDHYRCQLCKKTGVELEVDHILPVSRGGTDRFDNLRTLCWPCNRKRGNKLDPQPGRRTGKHR